MLFIETPAALGDPLLFQMVIQGEPIEGVFRLLDRQFQLVKVLLEELEDVAVALSHRCVSPLYISLFKDALFSQ